MGILERALNIGEGKQFNRYEQRVATINAFEPELELDDDDELRARLDALRERARAAASRSTTCCPSASRSCARRASATWGCATSTSS